MGWGFVVFTVLLFCQPCWALPKRLILALDGVSYDDVSELQKQGFFSDFRPVSRAVSTYPSLSDVSWSDIFSVYKPVGYQRYHYSIQANRIVGGALSDLGNPIEFEKRMHVAFESKIHHGVAYLAPLTMGKREIKGIIKQFLESKETGSYYAYMLSTDTLQHTDGDIQSFLKMVSAGLTQLSETYQEISDQKLELVLLSDHGNNKENRGIRVPVKNYLIQLGYHVGDSVKNENDVVFTAAGILTSINVYARPSQISNLSRAILELEGVDLVTTVVPGDYRRILVTNSLSESAYVVKKENESSFAYLPIQGDPLDYLSIVKKLAEAGKLDADGFARAEDWMQLTTDHHYPVALERIYRGHYIITMNVAPLIVSLKDGYENANETVKALSKFKSRGGTHGALSAKSSNGIWMTNYLDTADTTSNRLGQVLDFSDLPNYRNQKPGAEIIDYQMVGYNLDTGEVIQEDHPLGPEHTLFLNIWDPLAAELQRMQTDTSYMIEVRKDGPLFYNPTVSSSKVIFSASELPRTSDFTEFRIPISSVVEGLESVSDYWLEVFALRIDTTTGSTVQKAKISSHKFTTDIDGHLIAY